MKMRLLLVQAVVAPLLALAQGETEIWVSPMGDDAAVGTRERPLRTWTVAARAVAAQKAKGGLPSKGLAVVFSDGAWDVRGPICLGSEVSGVEGRPVVFRAENRGKAVVSGGARLSLRPLGCDEAPLLPTASRAHVRVAEVPGTGALPRFNNAGLGRKKGFVENGVSLFEEGVRLSPSRWPEGGFALPPPGRFCRNESEWREPSVECDVTRLVQWAKEPEMWICGPWKIQYAESVSRILRIDVEKGLLSIEPGFCNTGRMMQPPYFTFNAFCELDKPGEWVVDRTARKVYVWPRRQGSVPVLAANAGLLVVSNAHDVVFEGFVFEHARETAIRLADCTNVTLAASCVRQTSEWGVDVTGGRNVRVVGCDLDDLGQGGVSVTGGDIPTLEPSGHIVENCHVGHYGQLIWNYRPGIRLKGFGCRASHNLVHHSRGQGITFEGGEHEILLNVVHDVCRFNCDAGAIYGYMENWTGRASRIEGNCVHMTGNQPRSENLLYGIYLDAYTSDVLVRSNIVNRASGGIFVSGGHGNVVERNVILNAPECIHRWNLGLMGGKTPFADVAKGYDGMRFAGLKKMLDSPQGEKWRKRYPTIAKIYAVAKARGPEYAQNALFDVFRDNVCVAGVFSDYVDLATTREHTVVTNNVDFTSDPGFTDYLGWDWSLRPDAPARKTLGGDTLFAEMGLYADELRFSPARRFAADATPPRPLGTEYCQPKARIDVVADARDVPPDAQVVATECVRCRPMPEWKKRRIQGDFGAASYEEWRQYSYSFVPMYDCRAKICVSGSNGDKTAYDDLHVEGAEGFVDGGFEEKDAWVCGAGDKNTKKFANCRPPLGIVETTESFPAAEGKRFAVGQYRVGPTSREFKLKKGRRVTVSFKARAYPDGWKPVPCPTRTPAEPMLTEWGETVTPETAWRSYPRPQMIRANWTNLNGLWDYAVTPANPVASPFEDRARAEIRSEGRILVPFAIESSLSGVGRLLGKDECLWYRRTIDVKNTAGRRLLLNFGAVDFRAQVFVGHREVTDVPHEGGSAAFQLDLTDYVTDGPNELVVCVWDPTTKGPGSTGKQSFDPSGCHYTRVSGIWQTVWLEEVPETHVTGLTAVPQYDQGVVSVSASVVGDLFGARMKAEVLETGRVIAAGEFVRADRPLVLKLPSGWKSWSPDAPHLYDMRVTLTSTDGTSDVVTGSFGMRKFEKRRDGKGVLRFFLNDRPIFAYGPLDQGWWPDGLLTPPAEEAIRHEIRTLKAMGFNMLRKHIKAEPSRYYRICDEEGILVFQDMPCGHYRDVPVDVTARYATYRAEFAELIARLRGFPSVVMWCPYNEDWTQPGEFFTHMTLDWVKRLDPTRLVDGPSGWVDYEGGDRMWNRRGGTFHRPDACCEAGDVIDNHTYRGPVMFPVNSRRISFLGEFGGLGQPTPGHLWKPSNDNWGYGGTADTSTRADLERTYCGLVEKLVPLAEAGLSGAVYTQTTDVEIEVNGLMTYDRKVQKFDTKVLSDIHCRIYDAARVASEAR